jgi:hypothetical protein
LEVSPVAEGRNGGTEDFGCLGEGEELGFVGVGVVGHGCLLAKSGVVGPHL